MTGSVLAALLLFFITLHNVLGLDQLNRRGIGIPRPIELMAKVLRNDQRWAMFAPTPDSWNGWFVIPAKLKDGSDVDIWLGNSPPTTDRPEDPGAAYPNIMVKRFMTSRRRYPETPPWIWFARYVTREWNATHPPEEAVVRMRVVFVGRTPEQPTPFLTTMVVYDAESDKQIPLPKS